MRSDLHALVDAWPLIEQLAHISAAVYSQQGNAGEEEGNIPAPVVWCQGKPWCTRTWQRSCAVSKVTCEHFASFLCNDRF